MTYIEIFPEGGGEEENWRRYDPACERLDVAIKAIWLLYRRARWGILEDLMGMPRSDLEPIFGRFDMREIASDHGKIRTETQVFALLRMFNVELEEEVEVGRRYKRTETRTRTINPLLGAAMQMISDYMWVYRTAKRGKTSGAGTETAS